MKSWFVFFAMLTGFASSSHAVEVVSKYVTDVNCIDVHSADDVFATGLASRREILEIGRTFALKAIVNVEGMNYVNPLALYREIATGVIAVPSLLEIAGVQVPLLDVDVEDVELPFATGQVGVTISKAGICEFIPTGMSHPSDAEIDQAIEQVLGKILKRFTR